MLYLQSFARFRVALPALGDLPELVLPRRGEPPLLVGEAERQRLEADESFRAELRRGHYRYISAAHHALLVQRHAF